MSKTILVVDDDKNILKVFERFLRQEGYEVLSATNSDTALKIIQEKKIDLLISDLRILPHSGATLMIEAQITDPKLPAIIMTAYPQTLSLQDLEKMGASYIFVKPLELNQIRDAVRNLLVDGRL